MALPDVCDVELFTDDFGNKLDEIVQGYKNYQIVYAAIEFGLFKYLLENEQASKEEISQALGIKRALTKSFLQVLVEMGWVVQQEKLYSNSAFAEKMFSNGDHQDRTDWIRLAGIHHPNWQNIKDTLAEQEGEHPAAEKDFVDYLAQRSICGETQAILKTITGWEGFLKSKSILDIGGGHALISIALCQKNEALTAKVIDKPYLNQYIQQYHMENRIVDLGDDIPKDSVNSEFDIVIANHYLYQHRKYLEYPFEKIYQLIKPGGLFVANHWFCEVGCAPESSGIMALDKAFLSFGHPLCHVETFSRFFIHQGFLLISEEDIPSIYGSSRLHAAIKDSSGAAAENTSEELSVQCCE